MLAEERFNRILNIVEERKVYTVTELTELLGYFRIYDTKGI